MRRTDVSRKLGKIHTNLETFIKAEEIKDVQLFDINYITTIVKNMLDLRVHTVDKLNDETIIAFVDDDFDGVIQKKELYSDNPKLKKQKIKEIERCAKASILINLSNIENEITITLLGHVNYTNKEDLKGNTKVTLKRLQVPLDPVIDDVNDMTTETTEKSLECHTTTESNSVDKSVSTTDTSQQEIIDDGDYHFYIEQTLTNLFKEKYYDSIPSDKFIGVVIDKLHEIYVVKYLNKTFTKEQVHNRRNECYSIIEKLLCSINI